MIARLIVASALASLTAACANPAEQRQAQSTKPTYDKQTGRLKELAYDATTNGRADTWTDMDGAKPLRSRVDRDEDGKVDRWEYYDEKSRLVKVGFSRHADGTPDAWAFSGEDGKVQRIEISSTRNEQNIDRIEYYDTARARPDGKGAMIRAEADTDRDGRIDQWETYQDDVLATIAYDENRDGTPDRRLTYAGSSLVAIESEPDASGRFTKRRNLEP
jgi:hypothetical protein